MKKFMSTTLSLCTLAVMLVLLSCTMNAADSLIGKWLQVVDENVIKIVTNYEFNADGNMKQVFDLNSSTTPYIKVQGEGGCKYTFQDNTLTFKFNVNDVNDFKFSVFEVEGVDATIIQAIMEQTKRSLVEADMEQKITDIKINGNELTGKFNGQELKLTRK